MSIGPNYKVMTIDLGSAGSMPIEREANYFHFVRAEDGDGALALDAEISVALGTATDHFIPLGYNAVIHGYTRRYLLVWSAQPGIKATILLSWQGDRESGVQVNAPPAKQLITQASSVGFASTAVTVGLTAVQLAAASATRQAVSVWNGGSTTIYIGASNVSAIDGFPIAPGAGFVVDGTSSSIYAVSGTAGQDVRVLVEG